MENDQIPREMDLQALLASINSNFEAGLATNSSENRDFPAESLGNPANSQANAEKVATNAKETEETPQNPEKTAGSPQKTNVFTVVRAKPEEFEDLDPLLSTLERIKPVFL